MFPLKEKKGKKSRKEKEEEEVRMILTVYANTHTMSRTPHREEPLSFGSSNSFI